MDYKVESDCWWNAAVPKDYQAKEQSSMVMARCLVRWVVIAWPWAGSVAKWSGKHDHCLYWFEYAWAIEGIFEFPVCNQGDEIQGHLNCLPCILLPEGMCKDKPFLTRTLTLLSFFLPHWLHPKACCNSNAPLEARSFSKSPGTRHGNERYVTIFFMTNISPLISDWLLFSCCC